MALKLSRVRKEQLKKQKKVVYKRESDSDENKTAFTVASPLAAYKAPVLSRGTVARNSPLLRLLNLNRLQKVFPGLIKLISRYSATNACKIPWASVCKSILAQQAHVKGPTFRPGPLPAWR